MAVPKGTKRYKHVVTEEVRYFRNPPNPQSWMKVGTVGSRDWMWIHSATEEKYVKKNTPLPEGFSFGRLKN
tara:strand:- start:129 stop:341 length:213 start_codon:yes stop_codon:yes gene_type:complete